MTELRQLTVLGRYGYSSIPVITQFVAEAAQCAQLDEDAIFHCQMAVDEACTNVIEHAYGEENIEDFDVICSIEPGSCTIKIVDHGKSFDPKTIPSPKFPTKLEEMKPGGFGVHLMRKLMDDVKYEFEQGRNMLTMVKASPQIVSLSPYDSIPVREDAHGIWVIEPHGQVDSSEAINLDIVISNVLKQGHTWLVADLANVTYVSSRGLKALVSGWRQARDAGGQFVLCSVIPRVQDVIDTIGFSRVFKIYTGLSDSLDALVSEQRKTLG